MVSACALPRCRVLVTDDDASIRLLVAAVLRRAHYDVDTAANGVEALRKSESTFYDVIVLDLMMPMLSGFEVLRQLKCRESKPRFVVVMSAGSQSQLDSVAGANVFATMRKPFEIDAITAAVGACAGRVCPHAKS